MNFVDSCVDRSWSNAFTLSTLSHFHFLYIIWCVNRICIFSWVSFFLASTSIRNKRTGSKAQGTWGSHFRQCFFLLLYGCCCHCYFLSIGNFLNIPSIFHSKNGNVLTFLLNYFICMGSFGIFFAILFASIFNMDFKRGKKKDWEEKNVCHFMSGGA